VAHAGRVTQVRGSGFPPDSKINLTWGTTGPVSRATVSRKGTFTAYIPVSQAARGGFVSLTAADDKGQLLATIRVLVEDVSLQPPLFRQRS
jgi:hypothetical protein